MTSEQTLQEFERYRTNFSDILGRFREYRIHRGDDPRYRTFVIEIIDFINDSFGQNRYSALISQKYHEGITNELRTPSYKSVEEIISVIDSILTRLKRNPDFFIKKEEPEKQEESIKTELKPPDKVTLKWLWEHVPYTLWCLLIGLLISAFTLGVTVADTKIYKSATSLLTPNTSTNKNVTPTSK